jgi:hypothetical protein
MPSMIQLCTEQGVQVAACIHGRAAQQPEDALAVRRACSAHRGQWVVPKDKRMCSTHHRGRPQPRRHVVQIGPVQQTEKVERARTPRLRAAMCACE